MLKKLLFITAICLAAFYAWFYMYNNYGKQKAYIEFDDDDRQEVVVVSKTPRGAFAGEEKYLLGWYEIGLSRNGEEPVEYIWRADDEYGYSMINARIGERGTIYLCGWAKERNIKLRQPNAEKPPIIGALGEVDWEKRE